MAASLLERRLVASACARVPHHVEYSLRTSMCIGAIQFSFHRARAWRAGLFGLPLSLTYPDSKRGCRWRDFRVVKEPWCFPPYTILYGSELLFIRKLDEFFSSKSRRPEPTFRSTLAVVIKRQTSGARWSTLSYCQVQTKLCCTGCRCSGPRCGRGPQ